MARIPPRITTVALATALAANAGAGAADDARQVAALDTEYQAAVERNDWRTMERILHPDYVLALGNGKVVDRATLIDIERSKRRYEKQVEVPGTQVVRMYGPDTAVVTALLWLKGVKLDTGEPFDFKLWFSDTYVRTKDGWKYAFGQASLPLPPEPAQP